MVLFAENHCDFVKKYYQFPNGIPSHDTFDRAFSSLNPSVLNQCLEDYAKLKIETRKCSILSAKKCYWKKIYPRG